jgi:hypothetical protein
VPQPRYFRPPYGNLNNDVLEVLNERGYRGVFLWNKDTKDADGAGADEGKRVYDNIMNAAPRSAMVLNHETIPGTVHRVMPYALPGLNHAGLRLVTAAECSGHGSDPSNWYERVGGREERNVSELQSALCRCVLMLAACRTRGTAEPTRTHSPRSRRGTCCCVRIAETSLDLLLLRPFCIHTPHLRIVSYPLYPYRIVAPSRPNVICSLTCACALCRRCSFDRDAAPSAMERHEAGGTTQGMRQ